MNLFGKSQDELDVDFMAQALKQAQRAYEEDEVPVGAVLVLDNKVIAKGYNQVELLKDATAHAEMLCITSGEIEIGDWRLNGSTLYTTLEPCLMCAGAIYASRISRVVWAAKDLRVGANGSWIDVFSKKHPMHEMEITSGILQDESAFLLKSFFQKQRKKNEQSSKLGEAPF